MAHAALGRAILSTVLRWIGGSAALPVSKLHADSVSTMTNALAAPRSPVVAKAIPFRAFLQAMYLSEPGESGPELQGSGVP